MSNATASSSLEADVTAALAEYDRTRAADALRNATDQLVRDDGVVPEDPAAAIAQGRIRLTLWLAVFVRFHRDLDPTFDPENPPPRKAPSPVINGRLMPPFAKPSDLADPDERKQFEDAIAANNRRVQQFTAMFKLSAIHAPIVENAIGSLRNARDTLGLPVPEITAMLNGANIATADKAALLAGMAP